MHQHAHVELSELGRKQAAIVAERFKRLPVERIIASTHTRAHQTAVIIAEVTGKPLETSDLFTEMRRPSLIVGKQADDPAAVKIRAQIDANFHDEGWHHSDEENHADLKQRAQHALAYLLEQPFSTVLVVTHGTFLTVLLSVMAFGDQLTSRETLAIKKFAWTTNTGLTICDYLDGRWRLVTFNDYAHLG